MLKGVVAEAVAKTESIGHFPRKMAAVRRKLLGDQDRQDSSQRSHQEKGESEEETLLLEAILVIDEFCKELAAVTFVK